MKKVTLLSLVIFLLGFYIAVSPLRSDYAEAQSDPVCPTAAIAEQKEHYQQLVNEYTLAIENDPDEAANYLERADAFSMLAEREAAVADLVKFSELEPENVTSLGLLAASYIEIDQYGMALQASNQAIRLDPESAEQYLIRVTIFTILGHYDEALEDIELVFDLSRDDDVLALAYDQRGIIHWLQDRPEQALADYTLAIQLAPDFAEAYAARAQVWTHLGEYEQALSDYNRAIEYVPLLVETYINRGNLEYDLGNENNALANYDCAILIKPNHAGAYYNRANIFWEQGDYERAIENHNQAIEYAPDWAGAYVERANTYVSMEEYELAVADYTYAIELDPNNALAFSNRSVAYILLGEFKLALNDLDRTLELDPTDIGAYGRRAYIHATTDEFQDCKLAHKDLDRLIQLAPAAQITEEIQESVISTCP